MNKKLGAFSAVAALAFAGMATGVASAATTTVVVTGNTVDTSLGADGSLGWWFDRDQTSTTPYAFTIDQSRIGHGSLYVPPIGANPTDKFIAENFVRTPITRNIAISFDYLLMSGHGADVYLNVYANTVNDAKYYDCRFDYVGSDGGGWKTVSSTAPAFVQRSTTTRLGSCPSTLTAMPPGSYIRAFAINVGQSVASDVGLSAYIDKVVFTTGDNTTTYDFEADKDGDGIPDTAPPADKDACKQDGYKKFNNPSFKNQGQCVSWVNANT